MTAANHNDRPGLAIIANCMTPYRAHLHATIAAGIPEIKLHTLISHGAAEFDWKVNASDEINSVQLGFPGDSPIAQLYNAPLREWRKGGRLIKYLVEHDIRAVIVGPPRYMSYLRVLLYCHRKELPLFIHSDANIRSERLLSLWKRFVKMRYHSWWLRRVSGVLPMSSCGDEYFIKYGMDRRRIYRMPCWPDFQQFAAIDPVRLNDFRRMYGLREDRRYFIFSGRLVRVKRVDLLIDAFTRIAVNRPEWDLLVVGGGVLQDDLKRRVPQKLSKRIIWTGFLDESGPAAAYHAADVLVLPSDREPWAVVIQEAMAAGLPVVSSDVAGAARDIVEDGVSGRIFPAGDLNSLTSALLEVSSPDQLVRYKEQSRNSLAAWRERTHPVAAVRRALADAGVLPRRPLSPASLAAKRETASPREEGLIRAVDD